MNKKLFLLGVVTIGLLLLGSLPAAVAQDDFGIDMGDLNGAVDLSYDLSLTHVGSPVSSTPNGLTNTNLRYNLTSMKSPLDQFFNVGAFMFDDPDTGPMPEFMVNGTFEGSELFVKIVNDQNSVTDPNNRLLDWQATLTLKDSIDFEVLIPEDLVAEANLQGIPIDLIPTTVSIPAGSGIPPLPVIQSTTNFSYFEDLGNFAKSYGYDGLPFVTPAIFYVEDIADANDYWTSVDINQMFGVAEDPEDNRTITVTPNHVADTYFELTIEASFFNTTMEFGNVSLYALWGDDGWLSTFDVTVFADLDESYSFESEEEFFLQFDLIDENQADLPIRVGDGGEYIINMDFSATLDLENVTEQDMAQGLLDEISASINELDGKKLLNYSVDAMDGLYYHIDGYLLDLERFMTDRLGFFSSEPTVGVGAQTPLPIEDYYMSISGMDQGNDDFALNLFDAGVYRNDSMFYETLYNQWAMDENTTNIYQHMPGVTNAKLYSVLDWNMYWNHNLTIEENIVNLQSYEINGDVQYVEDHIQIVANDSFLMSTSYVAVLEIVPPMQLNGFNSYQAMTSPYMLMFMENDNGGSGAADDPVDEMQMSIMGLSMQSLLPLPARTPDWEQVGGPIVFLEGYIMQVSDVITSPDFISYLEEMAVSDPGDSLNIHDFNVGLDWMVNATHAGAMSWVELNMTSVDNDTGNMTVVSQSAEIYSYESYLWHSNGVFDVAEVSVQMRVDVSSVDWPDDPGTTTTTTIPPEDNTTTTTETTLELTPGFEVIFTLGSLIALPLFFKKRR